MVGNKGASVGGHDSLGGQHPFSWRDAMDIPVRWRQLSEPNDQVKPRPQLCLLHTVDQVSCLPVSETSV